jgi:hypothetical protein
MVRKFRGTRTLGLSLLFAVVPVWGSVAMAQQTPSGAVNATCANLVASGYKAPGPEQVPSQWPNLLVDDCYPPYGNQIPNVNLTEDEAGNYNFPGLTPPPPRGWNQESAWNMRAVGYNDNQGRVIYQPLIVHYTSDNPDGYANHEIMFNGNIAGSAPNPQRGNEIEYNGTTVLDVTNPRNPTFLVHVPTGAGAGSLNPRNNPLAQNEGSQMVHVCSGDQLYTDTGGGASGAALKGHMYLLRAVGNSVTTANTLGTVVGHELWDVTNPAAPTPLAIPYDTTLNPYNPDASSATDKNGVFLQLISTAEGPGYTHKSWWECDTGIAFIVAGQPSDGFHQSGSHQHLYIYDLKDPNNPVFIRQFGLVGQEPPSTDSGPCTNAPGPDCYEGTTGPPGGIHGPVSMGSLVNRVYSPYGIGSDGVIQIAARDKMVYGCYTSADAVPTNLRGPGSTTGPNPSASADCAKTPTQADLLYPQVSVVTMQPTQGGHSSMPILGVPIPEEQASYLTEGNPVGWDLLFISSEGTAANCSGQDAHEAWIETIGIFQEGSVSGGAIAAGSGGFPRAPGGFANLTGSGAYGKVYSATDAQQWPEATLSVPEQPGGFCAKGFRYGAHAATEAINPAYYGKIQCVSWFGAGARCWDIRDPKNPRTIAYWTAAPTNYTVASCGAYYPPPGGTPESMTAQNPTANAGEIQSPQSATATYCRNATDQDYIEFDDRGYLYVVDRAGTGVAILQFSGGAQQVITAPTVPVGTCPDHNCGSAD